MIASSQSQIKQLQKLSTYVSFFISYPSVFLNPVILEDPILAINFLVNCIIQMYRNIVAKKGSSRMFIEHTFDCSWYTARRLRIQRHRRTCINQRYVGTSVSTTITVTADAFIVSGKLFSMVW